MIEQITYGNLHPDGDHYTEWRFHTAEGLVVTAQLATFERHPNDESEARWRYARLEFASGAFIERIGAPLDQWIVNARASFGTLRDAAEYAIAT